MAIKINNSTIIDDSRNIVNAGIVTATSFVGSGSGLTNVGGIGTQVDINTTGIITASSFVGNLTGTATGLTGSPDVTVGVLTATTISAGSTTGTSGQVLQSTGTGVTWTTASGGISLTDSNVIGYNSAGIRSDNANGRLEVFGTGNFRVFTSPGTYVVNPGISSIRVRVVGAGGNGTPSPPTVSSSTAGGGGGGYAHKVIASFSAPRTYTVTVGSAPGGTSSFGSEVSATGGSNAFSGNGGSGGNGSGGDFNASGATGGVISVSPPTVNAKGGCAGSQKGNGSGADIAGIPNNVGSRFISRFPFDIFEGFTGGRLSPQLAPGVEGGSGKDAPGSGQPATPGGTGAGGGYGDDGGKGGIGGGGGGATSTYGPRNGGSGGPGIVIVEW